MDLQLCQPVARALPQQEARQAAAGRSKQLIAGSDFAGDGIERRGLKPAQYRFSAETSDQTFGHVRRKKAVTEKNGLSRRQIRSPQFGCPVKPLHAIMRFFSKQ